MWRAWAILGALIWLATIVSSGSMNYLAGYELGRSPIEANVFAVLGVSADIWKAIGPIFIATLWRSKKVIAASLASVVWIVCFVFAVSAALGLAARNRSAVLGGHEVIHASFESVLGEIAQLEERRRALGDVGLPAEREAAVALELARPVPGGTVGSLSENCTKDHWRAREGCAVIASLRRDLAKAIEGHRLDVRIDELRKASDDLRQRGATREIDPQAKLIARLSLGHLPIDDVGLMLTLVLVAMVELISAFVPVVIHVFVALMDTDAEQRAKGETGRAWVGDTEDAREVLSSEPRVAQLPPPRAAVGDVYEYIAARLEPDAAGDVSIMVLHADYVRWCARQEMQALETFEFASELDRIGESDLAGRIARRGDRYRGLRLRA